MQQIDAHIHNNTEGARHDPPIIIFGRAKEFDYKIYALAELTRKWHLSTKTSSSIKGDHRRHNL